MRLAVTRGSARVRDALPRSLFPVCSPLGECESDSAMSKSAVGGLAKQGRIFSSKDEPELRPVTAN